MPSKLLRTCCCLSLSLNYPPYIYFSSLSESDEILYQIRTVVFLPHEKLFTAKAPAASIPRIPESRQRGLVRCLLVKNLRARCRKCCSIFGCPDLGASRLVI